MTVKEEREQNGSRLTLLKQEQGQLQDKMAALQDQLEEKEQLVQVWRNQR